MDEKILLNRDEKREIWQRVHDVPATARMNGQPDWTPEYEAALCRAQLAKVVEWMKKNNCAPLQAQGTRTYAAHLVLPKESWQALKEAAGGAQ